MNRHNEVKREADAPAELESQFILRLPQEPCRVLREALRSGTTLKDRVAIKLENDMRYGEVRVDHWLMHAKVVDIPTVVESLKTIDGKSFYKTADVCQLVICKEEDDQTTTDEESPAKTKKKDPNKVDKKFLWPHGVTPPMKNVRRRRFRKTLKKKYVEAPEIEKEVKRLLRVDNDAVHVKWEIISEDDDKVKMGDVVVKEEIIGDASISLEASNPQSLDVAEHDIFGGAVSDSEDETNINIMELEDETSRPSAEDSRMSDTSSLTGMTPTSSQQRQLVTQFSKEMFSPRSRSSSSIKREIGTEFLQTIKMEPELSFEFDLPKSELSMEDDAGFSQQMTRSEVQMRLDGLEQQLMDLGQRRQQLELEISSMDNYALRQRFQDNLDNLTSEQLDKEMEYQELTSLMQQL